MLKKGRWPKRSEGLMLKKGRWPKRPEGLMLKEKREAFLFKLYDSYAEASFAFAA